MNERFPISQFIINCSLACAKRFQYADLTCCSSPVQHSDKLAHSPLNFLQTMSMHKGISLFFHLRSCHHLSEHFGLDDEMTSPTAWGLALENIWFELWRTLVHENHASKKRISIRNFELEFGMRDYWPSTIKKNKKTNKSQNFVSVALQHTHMI